MLHPWRALLMGQLSYPATASAVRNIVTTSWALNPADIIVPHMGDSITEGTISAVLKNTGDKVAENDVVAQIETDKVTIDVKAPVTGTLKQLHISEGQTVTPGQRVAVLEEADIVFAASPPPQQGTGSAAEGATEQKVHRMPSINFPTRRTVTGERLSALPAPAVQQHADNAAGGAASNNVSAATATSTPSSSEKFSQRPSRAVPRSQAPPPRRRLAEHEMEIIDLGGAIP